ncbi:MAG TPA: NAD-dependent epimerase/dehydratase family protein, partial [Aggregatilineales bacterium]|nr:NAD-dependent epimerase/dehydratase family protein [Aggregatilineales bacterium]
MRVLITGASGFSGYHLKRVLPSDWHITGLDFRPDENNTTILCDITRAGDVRQAVRAVMPDMVFHLAGVTPASKPDDEVYYAVNVDGTRHLFNAIREFVPEARVLLVTSSAIYGNAAEIDEQTPLKPVNAYGVSKAAQSLLGYQFVVQHGLHIVRCCPFNLIGWGLPSGSAASDFASQLAAIKAGNQEPEITVGNLNTFRDFLDAQDAVRAYFLLIQHGTPGETYNAASGQAVSIQSLLDELLDLSELENIRIKPGAFARKPVLVQT